MRALWGVGPKSEGLAGRGRVPHRRRHRAGVRRAQLEALFGVRGRELWEMANGRDEREIVTDYERKSVGAENDVPARPAGRPGAAGGARAPRAGRWPSGCASSGMRARTIAIKLRYSNFRTITRQTSRPEPTDDVDEILAAAGALLDRVVEEGDKFRLARNPLLEAHRRTKEQFEARFRSDCRCIGQTPSAAPEALR